MSQLPRPYIPLSIRVQVAERQFIVATACGFTNAFGIPTPISEIREKWAKNNSAMLKHMLTTMFGDQKVHLDHDPPLGARKKVFKRGVHVDYDPPANDPRYLVYRLAVDHRTKTNVRGEHGQHPDRVLIKKNRRLEERQSGKVPPRRKAKIAQRKNPWPSRPFSRRKG